MAADENVNGGGANPYAVPFRDVFPGLGYLGFMYKE